MPFGRAELGVEMSAWVQLSNDVLKGLLLTCLPGEAVGSSVRC